MVASIFITFLTNQNMKQHLLEKIIALSIFVKASLYKKGSLLALSTPLSLGTYEIFSKLVEEASYKDIVLPLVCSAVCIIVYFIFFIMDLIMGLIASKHESENNPDWVRSEKLYTSLGKIGGVLLINIIFLGINLFLVALDFTATAKIITILMVAINVLASLYEFHSIGENIKRKSSYKPKIFGFFDRVTNVLESKIMSRIVRTIDPKGDDYPEGER